ncbi:hypothetical protein LB465_11460 [Salegentibacter sp. LM13S]|uniref:hypothetical protein n=1 Tax=Salegentibacter lacus TaxID=2873599 RepID=UPI001CCCA47D|nr:hypothetical protein [Salegentibacter lacus]MBZ9631398.1 hypothetical protein [Salegentibacter lacus]
MILFNIKELEKLIITEKVSDGLAFKYLFTHLILFTLADYIPVDGDNPWWRTWVHLLISLMALIWGIRKTFEINQQGDNIEYFKRLISLSFVTGIRTIVFGFLIIFCVLVSTLIADQIFTFSIRNSIWMTVIELIAYALLNVVFYYILINSFKRINSIDSRAYQMKTN